MSVIGVDLGGTKLATAVFKEDGSYDHRITTAIGACTGAQVGRIITHGIGEVISRADEPVRAIGVSVPGISYADNGTVWAPNIPGWDRYPLRDEISAVLEDPSIPVIIDCDRSCYISAETWIGAAAGVKDAVFIAVGTGIGAGILVDGAILRGHEDIAGSVGWLALDSPYRDEYHQCGCFEYYASGEGIARYARKIIAEGRYPNSTLATLDPGEITAHDVFNAFDANDPIAITVFERAVELWGMAVANFVSIFNPEIIIFGGGVFGPAARFLPDIRMEAQKWAQPIAMKRVRLEVTRIGDDAGLIGAGRLALLKTLETGGTP